MQVVSFASTKGGVGKSTMAALTTDSLIRKGHSVRVIDLDPQYNLQSWAEAVKPRNANLIVSEPQLDETASFIELYNELVEIFEDETDWVIIDTAGKDSAQQHPALAISDLVVCPSGPVENELIGVQKTVEYLRIALSNVAPDVDPMDMLRVLYQEPIGFPDKSMLTFKEVLYQHFGVIDKIHRSSAITSFLGDRVTTAEAIEAAKAEKRSPKSFEKIQTAMDRFTTSLKEQFDV